MLEAPTRRALLARARAALRARLAGESWETITCPPQLPELARPGGLFVTWHTASGALRGCIGLVESQQSLWHNAAEMACAAGLGDPRFPQVTADELPSLALEISVMSPPRDISSINEIQIGTHGLIAAHRGRRGLLLPQVATEYQFGPEQFFQATLRKAGLASMPFNTPELLVQVFEAEVFSE